MSKPDIEAVFQMTPLQHGMVFHSAMHPGAGFYHEQVTFGLGMAIDTDLLQRSLDFVAKRHQVLRTGFFWENVKTPVQVVLRTVRIPVTGQDWTAEDAAQQGRLFAEFLEQDRARPFDLRRAPLMRACVLRLGRNTCQLVFSFHHAILDGWSLNRLFREIWEVYRVVAAGQIPNLPPAPAYADFLGWLGAQDAGAARQFWSGALADVTGPAALPVLRDPEPGSVAGVGHIVQELPDTLGARLKKAARAHRVTLNAVFQAAWAILLGRLSGSPEAVFGTIVSGRPPDLDGVEDMIGLFINTVPLRVPLRDDMRAADLWRLVHDLASERRAFEHCSLTEIQGWSRVPNGTPLFETLFIFENLPGATKAGAGQAFAFERTNYPLTLLIAPAERISLKLLYETARLSQGTARMLIEQFASICAQMADDAARPLAGIVPVTGHETRRTPQAVGDPPPTLDEIWRNRAGTAGDRICVIDGERELDVGALDRRVRGIAIQLAQAGAGRGDVIAIRDVEAADLVAAIIAVLERGAAFLLVDPSYPEARQRQMLDGARPHCLIGTAPDGYGFAVIDPAKAPPKGARRPPPLPLTPEDAAFVVFTSGSTGAPKGVVQTHRALANRLIWGWRSYPFAEAERVLQKTPLGFVDAIAEILAPVLGGAALVMTPGDIRRDPAALSAMAAATGITRITAVPSLLSGLAAHLDASGQSLPRLRMIHSSGEALSGELLRKLHRQLPKARVLNLYGSSEVAADATAHLCDSGKAGSNVPIGADILGLEIRLLDPALRPVPLGAVGEIYVAGEGLARGYLDRPGETARRFVPDIARPGQRMFRTGDLAWRRHDGALIFAGRADNQINLRGTRIEPEEIEAICMAQEGVAGALAHIGGNGALCVALMAQPGAHLDPEALRRAIAQRLPQHMWPDRILPLDRLPLLPNGKVDRSAISQSDTPRAADRDMSDPPATEAERMLAQIWSELLGVPPPGRRDNFFALGGHSVLAMQVASRVLKRTGQRLPLNAIFERPVLSEMAQALSSPQSAAPPEAKRIGRAKRKTASLESPRA